MFSCSLSGWKSSVYSTFFFQSSNNFNQIFVYSICNQSFGFTLCELIFPVWLLVTFYSFCMWLAHLDSVVDTGGSIVGTLESAMLSEECWFCLPLTCRDSTCEPELLCNGQKKISPHSLRLLWCCLLPPSLTHPQCMYNSQVPRTVGKWYLGVSASLQGLASLRSPAQIVLPSVLPLISSPHRPEGPLGLKSCAY